MNALVIIDAIHPYEHEDSDAVADHAAACLPSTRSLLSRAREHPSASVVYVNDNHGDWSRSSEQIVQRALAGRHAELIEPITPAEGDMFVVKGRHSGFYRTTLDLLLREQDLGRLVLCGQVTEQCVFYTAADAYMRGYDLTIARDGVVHADQRLGEAALKMMRGNLSADVLPAAEIAFE